MQNLEILKGVSSNTAEGKNRYFSRERIVENILFELENGENLLISAPRRIGKSTILKYIKNNYTQNQIIKYIAVESVDSQEEFFKRLFNALISDKEIFEGISGYLTRATSSVKVYIVKITGFSINGNIKIDHNESINYYEEFIKLIESFKTNKKIILFIDEFPDALNNILKKSEDKAINFLQQNRDIRQKFSDINLQFLYTGSTGLSNVVKKTNKLNLINDLTNIKVPPLSSDESKSLIQRLVLGYKQRNESFDIDNETIEYILSIIRWRIPYYMQIITKELYLYYDEEEKKITNDSVDYILKQIVKSNSNHSDYFENWKSRLKTAFKYDDYAFAIEVLNYIAKNETLEDAVFCDLAVKYKIDDHKYILNVLKHDGYISEDEKVYGFNSILLKQWWYINVAT